MVDLRNGWPVPMSIISETLTVERWNIGRTLLTAPTTVDVSYSEEEEKLAKLRVYEKITDDFGDARNPLWYPLGGLFAENELDPFSPFDRTLTCDRQRRWAIAYAAQCIGLCVAYA